MAQSDQTARVGILGKEPPDTRQKPGLQSCKEREEAAGVETPRQTRTGEMRHPPGLVLPHQCRHPPPPSLLEAFLPATAKDLSATFHPILVQLLCYRPKQHQLPHAHTGHGGMSRPLAQNFQRTNATLPHPTIMEGGEMRTHPQARPY